MTLENATFLVWGVLTVGFLTLLAYTATLTRYEDDQLFLNSHNHAEEALQHKIVQNVQRAEPMLHAFGGASALLGTLLVGLYTWHAWQFLHT